MATPVITTDDLFAKARDEFLSTLSPREQAQFTSCSSVQEVLDAVKHFDVLKKSIRRSRICTEKISKLGGTLEPYFKTLELVCTAFQPWGNIALSSLLLVLKLASNFATFFEKLCDTIQTLSGLLPRYQELYDCLCQNPSIISERLRGSLQNVYCHLFQFFAAVARTFSNKDGKIHRTPIFAMKLVWKPFDARYQAITEKIKFHTEIVREELQFASVGQLRAEFEQEAVRVDNTRQREWDILQCVSNAQQETFKILDWMVEAQDEQAQRTFQTGIVHWLDSPNYKMNLEQAKLEKMDGTSEWLFEEPTITGWISARSESTDTGQKCPESLLLIQGNMGSGKTVLASSLVDMLDKGGFGSDEFPSDVCYYFFSKNGSDCREKQALSDFYRAFAAQLFRRFHDVEIVHNIFAFATLHAASDPFASESELVETISQCLPHLPHLYLVIDGVDECADNARLLRQISVWCTQTPLRVVLLSRPTVACLHDAVRSDRRIHLTSGLLDHDISMYLDEKIQDLLARGMLPDSIDKDHAVDHLTRRAEGMFLWARLMVSCLESPAMTRSSRLHVVMESSTRGLNQLNEMYHRIQTHIENSDVFSRELVGRAFAWVAHASLRPVELREALYPDGWSDEDGGIEEFVRVLAVVSCGVLETGKDGRFRFIHLSALEYAFHGSFIPERMRGQSLLAAGCLSYLLTRVPSRPLFRPLWNEPAPTQVSPEVLDQKWPLMHFACMQWIELCVLALHEDTQTADAACRKSMVELGTRFLHKQTCLMVWIEAIYTYRASVRTLIRSSSQLSEKNPQDQGEHQLFSEIQDFVKDLTRLDNSWQDTLYKNPAEIWDDVTVFTQSRFLRQTTTANLECLPLQTSSLHGATTDSGHAVFSTSLSSADASQLGVLSVFPNSSFRRGWENKENIPSYPDLHQERRGLERPSRPNTPSELHDACRGWFATYEILSVKETRSEQILRVVIPLKSEDIAICLKQSLCFYCWDVWMCSFPLRIAPQLNKFSILNDLYHLTSGDTTYTRTPLAMHSHPYFEKYWNPEAFPPNREDQYLYRLYWSHDACYVAYTDSRRSIALFEVSDKGTRLATMVHLEDIYVPPEENSCAFHPVHRLFMYQTRTLVYFWEFEQLQSKPYLFCRKAQSQDNVFDPVASFSDCGQYLVISHPTRPKIIPLLGKDCELGTGSKRQADDGEGIDCRAVKRQRQTNDVVSWNEGSRNSVTGGSICMPNSVRSGTALVKHDSTGSQISIIFQETEKREIVLVNRTAKGTQNMPLVTLPRQFSGMPVSSTAVFGARQCKIILTAEPQLFYRSRGPTRMAELPLVIRKEKRALRVEQASSDRRRGTAPVEYEQIRAEFLS